VIKLFKRLIKKIATPRTKKKEIVMTVKFTFEVANDNEDEAKEDVKRFKDWMKDQFTQWDNSMLQYFLYAYGLQQDPNNEKYKLEQHIDKIIRDESATVGEITDFMKDVKEEVIDEGNEEYIEDHDKESKDEPEEQEAIDDKDDPEQEIVEVRKKPQKQIKLKDV
jgi:hypothetical protein